MSLSRAMLASAPAGPDSCRDRIEEQIIRAYVQLALAPDQANGSRRITVAQFGQLEVRLTEFPLKGVPSNIPPLWVEVYSHASGSTIDSFGCFEFDEDELAATVELIIESRQSQAVLN